ncbi:MAG: SpvB/TcaC N-terminal domain-containing protein [Bacteroidetes bacterium]|nr:SpvB/TcaC N-terminal domain-containing protein [Bacteroidota bacterium]
MSQTKNIEEDEYFNIVPPSPVAYDLGKYGQQPIGNFTGSPIVNIPIYEFISKVIKVPISLNYSSNGIKVDEIGSNVGLGWSMNMGGVITRIIRDEPDEESNKNFPSDAIDDIWSIEAMEYLRNAPNEGNDNESDLYMYNFNGNSGKFIFSNKNQIKLIPNKSLRVELFVDPVNNVPNFKIITDDGVNYIFSATEITRYSKELISKDMTQGDPSIHITSWYLTNIYHPKGDTINFEYEGDSYNYYTSIAQYHYLSEDLNNGCTGGPLCSDKNALKTYKNKSSITGVRLKKISTSNYDNGHIEFDYNYTHPEAVNFNLLTNVRIMLNNDVKREIELKYFSTSKNRVFLESVEYLGQNKLYSFEYFNPDLLCQRLSFSQDYWGYYNEAPNQYFVPRMESGIFSTSTTYGNRNPNGTKAFYGLLNSIHYPTGGTTDFSYEPNTYYGTVIHYPEPANISLAATTPCSPTSNAVGTATTEIIPFNQEMILNASCHTYQPCITNNCESTRPPKAYLTIRNIIDNTYVEIFKQTEGGAWILENHFGTSSTVFKAALEEGGIYELKLLINLPNNCTDATVSTSYYDENYIETDENIVTGGMRVRQVIDNDANSQSQNITTYYYHDTQGKSTGDPGTKGSFVSKRIERKTCPVAGSSYDCEYYVLGSDSQIPLINSGNNNVYYTKVTISHGGENFENGGESFDYMLHRDVPDNPLNENSFSQNGSCFSNVGWDQGYEIKHTKFKYSNGVRTTLYEKENFYTLDNRATETTYCYNVMKNFDFVLVPELTHTCSADDVVKRTKKVKCVANNNHEHVYFFSPLPYQGIPNPTLCIAPGSNNQTYWDEHPCYGLTVDTVLIYTNALENLNITEYFQISHWAYLDSTYTTEYGSSGDNPVSTAVKYVYSNPEHMQLSKRIHYNSQNSKLIEESYFPLDYSVNIFDEISEQGIKSVPIDSRKLVDEKMVSGTLVEYNDFGQAVLVYQAEEELGTVVGFDKNNPYSYAGNAKKTSLTYDVQSKNLISYSKEHDKETVIIWGYSNSKPIMFFENATSETVNSTLQALNISLDDLQGFTENELINAGNLLRSHPNMKNSLITSYTYKPLDGLSTVTDQNANTNYYIYDSFGRLTAIKDNSGNILKTFDYNFAH